MLKGEQNKRNHIRVNHAQFIPQWCGFQPTGPVKQYASDMLSPNAETHSLQAEKGGILKAQGFAVRFSENALEDENRRVCKGRASLQMVGVRPGVTNFSFLMHGGDFYAFDANNEAQTLHSYGFVGAELTGTQGEKLNLRPGKKARIFMMNEDAQLADAPQSVPCWHFDETAGL